MCFTMKQTAFLCSFITMFCTSIVIIAFACTIKQVDATITSVGSSIVYFNVSSMPCNFDSTMQYEQCDNCIYYNGTTYPYLLLWSEKSQQTTRPDSILRTLGNINSFMYSFIGRICS